MNYKKHLLYSQSLDGIWQLYIAENSAVVAILSQRQKKNSMHRDICA